MYFLYFPCIFPESLFCISCNKKSGHGKILDWKRWGVQPLNGDSGAGTNVDLRVDFIICVEQEYHPLYNIRYIPRVSLRF